MKNSSKCILRLIFLLAACNFTLGAQQKEALHQIGVAKIDITPNYAIRLSGYGNRRKESEGVAQRIIAKGLALGSDKEGPALLVTVDNCGVPISIRNEVVQRLNRKKRINPDRV